MNDKSMAKLKAEEIATQPMVSVGIVSGTTIRFRLNEPYRCNGQLAEGQHEVHVSDGKLLWQGKTYDTLEFQLVDASGTFSIFDVVIGVKFHWERKEMQTFRGVLRLIVAQNAVVAINQLPVEWYLESVISSEMSATSSLELLKAHAVISRSWLLAQMQKRRALKVTTQTAGSFVQTETEHIRWYDREDHTLFDVCADDHCQRYQGITKETNAHVVQAVNETFGEVLLYDDGICDARFSKSCGGVVEEYQYCWENLHKPYLVALRDAPETDMPDLTNETQAEQWILTNPESYCNTRDPKILSQVLNDYDQETKDFYRWQVEYTQSELRHLIESKLNLHFGDIIDLQPVERGMSGRLSKLRIVGTERTLIIGKELEIRRALSPSHLYSSAFVVQRFDLNAQQVPARFVLKGAGWGHGVGLCQIGAAVMGERGFRYDEILLHYYRGVAIRSIYSKA